MKVSNMISPRSGRPVANQYIIVDDKWNVYFQSYKSIIAKAKRLDYKPENKYINQIYLDINYWDYSRTTLKYLNQFLGTSSKKEIQEKIKSGEYILTDLNK